MLHKHRLWLVAGMLAGMLVAAGWVLLPSPIYESRATIQIGTIREKGMIEESTTLTVRLIDQYGAESEHAATKGMPFLTRVVQASLARNSPRSPDILRFVAVAHSPESANDFLVNVVQSVVRDHNELYESYLAPLRHQLATISQEIASVRSQIGQLSSAMGRLVGSQPVQASILALEKGRLTTQLGQLEQDRFKLVRQINDPFSVTTRVLSPPTMPDRPARPEIFFAIATGILLGLALGIVAAFLRDIYTRARAAQGNVVV